MTSPRDVLLMAAQDQLSFLELLFDRASRLCESPIEELFLAGLLRHNVTAPDDERVQFYTSCPQFDALPITHNSGIDCWPQARFGRARVDFLLRWQDRKLAVECDGYAFHSSRTAVQRDKRRDREFIAAGVTVLRFTGSELYENPSLCAAEVIGVLTGG